MAVIQEAWTGGVSTRRLDELVQATGLGGISKSTVSRLCKDIDDRVGAFPNRPLTGDWPHVWFDATERKVRQNGRIVSVAAMIAVAANTDGHHESEPSMRHWSEHDGERARHRAVRGRDLLDGVPEGSQGPRARRREAGRQRRPHRPQGRHRARLRVRGDLAKMPRGAVEKSAGC